jgi:hypothetical protein
MICRTFYRFEQAKFAYGGSIISSSQFTILSKLPLKTVLDLKVVKIDSKIVILLHKSKSATHFVESLHVNALLRKLVKRAR